MGRRGERVLAGRDVRGSSFLKRAMVRRALSFHWDAGNVEHIARHRIIPDECEEAYRNGLMVIERQKRKHERRRLCLG